MNQECLIQKLWKKSLISITRIIGIIFVIIIFNGCHVFPHIYEEYSAGIPGYTIQDINSITKDEYEDYFIDYVYVCAYVGSTEYYPNFIRTKEPYYLSFHASSKKKDLKELVISSCIITSKDNNVQTIDMPIEFYFHKSIDPIRGLTAFIAKAKNGYEIRTKIKRTISKQKKFDVLIHVILTKEDDTVIEKDIKYVFKKNKTMGLIDSFIFDTM